MDKVDRPLEEWEGSPVIRYIGPKYTRKQAASFADAPAALSERQAVFYRNLITLAQCLKSADIPVDFEDAEGNKMYLDRGCIKIAEHAGFIRTLTNSEDGTVAHIRLSWQV